MILEITYVVLELGLRDPVVQGRGLRRPLPGRRAARHAILLHEELAGGDERRLGSVLARVAEAHGHERPAAVLGVVRLRAVELVVQLVKEVRVAVGILWVVRALVAVRLAHAPLDRRRGARLPREERDGHGSVCREDFGVEQGKLPAEVRAVVVADAAKSRL